MFEISTKSHYFIPNLLHKSSFVLGVPPTQKRVYLRKTLFNGLHSRFSVLALLSACGPKVDFPDCDLVYSFSFGMADNARSAPQAVKRNMKLRWRTGRMDHLKNAMRIVTSHAGEHRLSA
jgi:hypothetical protein